MSGFVIGCGGGSSSNSGGGGGNTNPPIPTVTSISPTTIAAGSADVTLTVNGTGFQTSTIIQVGGKAESTTFVSATQVTAKVLAAQLASGGDLSVVAMNGSETSGSGAVINFEVTNPTPAISGVSPSVLTTGTTSLAVTITGTGFVPTTVINVNGSARTTTFTNSTQVAVTLTAADVTAPADLSLTAVNSSPGGGTSTAADLTVAAPNPVPTITGLNPGTTTVGAASPVIAVTGTGFVSSTVINVNGSPRTTSFVSGTQVNVVLQAADLSAPGTLALTAVNPAPGGGTSASASLSVMNPVPSISSLNPATVSIVVAPPTVAVNGTGFVSTTVINVNGSPRNTSFVSSTIVNVTLTAADVSALGSLSLTAVNGAPGGGTSAAVILPVNNPPVGTLRLSPSALVVGGTSPATITVTGNTFLPSSTLQFNGTPRTAVYVNSTTLTFVTTVAEQASLTTFAITVTNPAPGGGTSPLAVLTIGTPSPTPIISSISPNPIYTGSPDTQITINGTGLTQDSTVQWNGTDLAINGYGSGYFGMFLTATVPAADLSQAGTATVTVNTPTARPALSGPVTVTISDPPAPTLTSMSPASGPIHSAPQVSLYGTGFSAASTVSVNGASIPVTFVSSSQLTVNLPASSTAFPGNLDFTVTTPPPGGGTSAPLAYTVYLAIPNNDIVYNSTDGLLYASVPTSSLDVTGNSVVGIDPATGNVIKEIWVGSNPNKLALSTDGTQLFVGLDGAGAVVQVNLVTQALVNQFSLGGGPGVYNPPYTAVALAAIPGTPNSVAVALSGSPFGGNVINIYDSGVARTGTSLGNSVGAGPLTFGSSASTLYSMSGSTVYKMTVDLTGITAGSTFYTSSSYGASNIQYDKGRLYLTNGQVVDASTGMLLGTFYASANTPANGVVVSDSALGKAFIGTTNYSNYGQVLAFDESTFNPTGSISGNGVGTQGYPTNFLRIVRWGQNGLALNTNSQIFVFQSSVVKDLSSSPADITVTLAAPANATTGTAISYVATVKNNGPNPAQGVILALNVDPSLIVNSITAAQGSCGTGTEFSCDLGNLASGATTTVTINATPTTAGTIEGSARLSATSYDPTTTNNQATSSTVVTGSLYGATPAISAISPSLIQAGSGDFTLTVTGAGFNADSTVDLGAIPLSTNYVSATELTATVPAARIATYGWGAVTVSNPAPGGGASGLVPLTIYGVVNVPANGLAFDPFSQKLYATLPSASTTITGNSIVAIDPVTGTVGTPVPIGSEPDLLAETTDGKYLWVGIKGANSLGQFDLLHQQLVATIPLTFTQYPTTTSTPATSLAAMPGSDTSLAIGISNGWGNFGIFDVSGNTGTFRQNLSGIYSGVNPVFADAAHLYAFDSQTSGAEFYRYSIDPNGLTLIDGTTLNGMGGFNGSFKLAGGLAYGGNGGVANPSTTPPSQIAVMARPDFYSAGITPFGVAVVPDSSTQKEFLMLENTAGTWAYGLGRYDLTTYLPEAVITMPAANSSILAGWTLLRWGQDGLALLSSANTQINSQAVTQILLLRGPFVTPQLLETHTKATLSSSSTTTIAHGAGNTVLTLTGSNFLPGVAVTWKGTYRTTTRIDATHLTVAIPASDVATAGTASLIATNPGAPASNSLTITIN